MWHPIGACSTLGYGIYLQSHANWNFVYYDIFCKLIKYAFLLDWGVEAFTNTVPLSFWIDIIRSKTTRHLKEIKQYTSCIYVSTFSCTTRRVFAVYVYHHTSPSTSIPFVMIERIYILCLIIIIKSEVWTFTYCLGLSHETMVCAVCLSVLLWICDMAGLLGGIFVSWLYLSRIWPSVTYM